MSRPAAAAGERFELAIVVVSHDCRDELERCIETLLGDPPATPFQLTVVDNASTDGSRELVGSRFPDVLLLESPENVGFARAVNRGVRATAGELVLLLNPDTLARGAAVDALVAELVRQPAVAAAGPRIVDTDGRPEISWWRHLGPAAELSLRRLQRAHARGSAHARRRVARLTAEPRDVDWLTGACLLVRRAALVAAGLLDERYFLYFEDVDLCAALRRRGGRVRFVPDAEIVHLRGRSTRRQPELTARAYRRSQLHFYRKHHPVWYPLLRLYLLTRGLLPG